MTITRKADALKYDQAMLHALLCALSWEPELTAQKLLDGVDIDTAAGPAYVHWQATDLKVGRSYLTGWLHVRFKNPKHAAKALTMGADKLNPYSGKWNWMDFDSELRRSYALQAIAALRPNKVTP